VPLGSFAVVFHLLQTLLFIEKAELTKTFSI